MKILVKNGTPQSGRSLCETCKCAGIAKGYNGELVIHCNADIFTHLRGNVPFKIYECSSYLQINQPDKYEMERMAWNIEARKRGQKGFVPEKGNNEDMQVVITEPKRSGNPINWPDD